MYEWLNEIVTIIHKNKNSTINEADTRDRLVRPFFNALGWDFASTDVVAEDANNTGDRPDYLFKYNDEPKFYLEIKRLNDILDKKTVIDKIKKYIAMSETVQLLIITNGAKYQIYYSRPEGDHKSKLLTAFDLREIADDSDRHTLLELLKYDSFKDDRLMKYAQTVYNNTAVANALQSILNETQEKSNSKFISTINKKINAILGHGFDSQNIIDALEYIDISVNSLPTESNEDITDNDTNALKGGYTDKLITGQWPETKMLYDELLKAVKILPDNIEQTKQWFNIKINNAFIMSITPYKKHLWLAFNDDYDNLSSEEQQYCRDMTDVGHSGNGNIRYRIATNSDITRIIPVIRRIIERHT